MNKKTKILHVDNDQDIAQAASMIQQGKVVAVPTETVYGLAADARNVDAVKQIFAIKNRPADHPLIVHIGSVDQLSQWADDIPTVAIKLAEHFWPGPLTLLLKKREDVSDVITGGLSTIAIRIPQNKALLQILNSLQTGVAAPSANPYKRISPTSAEHVLAGLAGKIEAVLDGGSCSVGVESTILDLTKQAPTILRHGPITASMIEQVINMPVRVPEHHAEHVSGNMKTHYQPYTTTILMSLQEIETLLSLPINQDTIFGVIYYGNLESEHANMKAIQLSSEKAVYTAGMYQALHQLDTAGVAQILVQTPPEHDAWRDVLDRLSKACAVDN